ncbi:hypothetical protein CONLIGDRAFT_680307 [Coniochaeta ligniaria NRRL 30616]|uniref:Uncharacterized protein n=1 Tax=Coniochaeta ligniaria NRRL 30616 TaxID=1408157 RepID=A0A1J7JNZ2_9PEZI|nr:hypothetical protein CONLIGDRAFT_680307 [Coniochaeta ligniaria NRRL 30616]
MATPTPVATYGRDAKIAEAIRQKLLPDIDVVHICLDLPSASTELPALCAGDLSALPSSGLGSNAGRPQPERRVPVAVFFGGGIPEAEMERVQRLVGDKGGDDAVKVRFLRITREEVLAAGAAGPDPEVIARLYRSKVAGL